MDIQGSLLSELSTRVVVPLYRAARFGRPIRRLNPVFDIDGVEVVMCTAEVAGISRRGLGARVASLDFIAQGV